jgi:glycosyltransferase involved in cell wall biosynthesis
MSSSLAVAHVVLSMDVGGLERNVVNQVREGHRLGQRVSVVCLERPGTLAPQVEELGGRVICVHKKPGIQLSLIGKLKAVWRELRPDIIHTHQVPTLFYSGLAARSMRSARVLHTEHGLPLFANRVRTRWLGRLSGLHCERFFCLTREMAQEVLKYRVVPRHKVRVIRNGIETSNYRNPGDPQTLRCSLGIPPAATVIGSVGRLVEIKRYDVLIRSFARLKDNCPDAHLLMVGDGPYKPVLEELAQGLGVREHVHFAGYRTNINEYLHAMNCFALTSSSEGTPQAVLEASIARLPVVASRVGGLPEVIDDRRTGILVTPGDEGAFTRELLGIVQNRELAARLGEAARVRVQDLYGIGRMAKEYHEVYLELLAERA